MRSKNQKEEIYFGIYLSLELCKSAFKFELIMNIQFVCCHVRRNNLLAWTTTSILFIFFLIPDKLNKNIFFVGIFYVDRLFITSYIS